MVLVWRLSKNVSLVSLDAYRSIDHERRLNSEAASSEPVRQQVS
jgi:hypothetical protein